MTKRGLARGEVSWGRTALILAATIFLIYKTNIQPALANNRSFEAQKLLGQNYDKGWQKGQEALNLSRHHQVDVRNDLARTVLSFSQSPEAMKSDLYKQSLSLIAQELEKTIKEHPLEINAFIISSQLQAVLGDFAKAEEMLEKAQELSPQRQQVAYMRTRLKYSRRDYEGAIGLLNKTISDDPNIADSYWYLSLVYYDLGKGEEAFKNLKIALEKGKSPQQIPELIFAADLAKKSHDLETARQLYEQIIAKQPNDPQTLLKLSEIYNLLGDKLKAQEMFDRAALYDPGIKTKKP